MDSSRGVKRPRSGTPVDPDGSSKKKDKNKKKKKQKLNPKKSNNETSDDAANSLESTATADGQYMAKILSTFSKMEQSRFEAFKRVSFPSNAISRYVAHCLAERQQEQLGNHHHQTKIHALVSDSRQNPQLQDLVVPGQEEEITTVVATLAKAYAQRLCAAAKAQAQVQAATGKDKDASATSSNKHNGDPAAIHPEHVLQAYYMRQQQGQDPGFFLQPNESITLSDSGKEQMKRVAALAAQEDFDRVFEEYQKNYDESGEQKQQSTASANIKKQAAKQPKRASTTTSAPATGTTPMEEDSDSGDEEEVELDLEKEMAKEMS